MKRTKGSEIGRNQTWRFASELEAIYYGLIQEQDYIMNLHKQERITKGELSERDSQIMNYSQDAGLNHLLNILYTSYF